MPDDTVQLIVGGKVYDQWTKIEIILNLEAISGVFDLGITDNWAGARAIAAIPPQSRCQVRIGGENVITGFVDCTSIEYDAETHDASVQGRDVTGDLVDCSYLEPDGGRRMWSGIDYLDLVKALITGFNIKLAIDPAAGISGHFSQFTVQPAEGVFEAIDRASRMVGALTVSDGNGGLLLTRAGSAPANSRLKLGENIKSASFKRDDKGRHDHYVVLGQAAGSDLLSVTDFVGPEGHAFDAGVKRYRPLIIMSELNSPDLGNYKSRALWEAAVRYGRAWRGTYTVNSWRDANGRLWRINSLVKVEDEFAGIDETLLICGVKFSIDEQGATSAELTVTRREAFLLDPLNDFINDTVVSGTTNRGFAPPPGVVGSASGGGQ